MGTFDAPLKKIAIHGVPRSGTTWLGELFNSSPRTIYRYQPLFSYALKGYVDEKSGTDRFEEFFSRLCSIQDEFVDQISARKTGVLPTFLKTNPTHVVYKEVRYHNVLRNMMLRLQSVKLVLLIRDPVSTLESWIRAPREFRSDLGWEINQEWRDAPSKNQNRPEEFYGFTGWKRAAVMFLELQESFPENVRIVRYKDLVESTVETITKLFEFCMLDLDSQTLSFIENSTSQSNTNPYSVYRDNTVCQAQNSLLGKNVVREIENELYGSKLETYLSKRLNSC